MVLDLQDANIAISMAAMKNGLSRNELIHEIELGIEEAMQTNDPLVKARWAMIPCAGAKPTALEFIAFMRAVVHRKQ